MPNKRQDNSNRPRPLTPRERQIYALLLDGRSNKEIAGVLNLGLRVTKFHVENVLDKEGAENRLDLVVRKALRFGPTNGPLLDL